MKAASKKIITATRAEVLKKLKACQKMSGADFERAHGDADDAVLHMLIILGEDEIVAAYDAIPNKVCA